MITEQVVISVFKIREDAGVPKKLLGVELMKKSMFYRQKKHFDFAVLTAMPVALMYDNLANVISVSRIGNRFIQRATSARIFQGDDAMRRDPKGLRDMFERVRTEDELESFLSLCGPFRIAELPQEITMKEFVVCQNFIREIREEKIPTSWPDGIPARSLDYITEAPRMRWGGARRGGSEGKPWVAFEAETALEAIGATLFIDRHEGVRVKKCEWKDCGQLYEVKSAHESRFCCESHRQLASQKARRDAARDKRAKEAVDAKA